MQLRRATFALSLVTVFATFGIAACDQKQDKAPAPAPSPPSSPVEKHTEKPAEPAVAIDEALLPAFGALPQTMESKDNPLTDEKIALGKALYYETKLSAANDISCNTCHLLASGGVDG